MKSNVIFLYCHRTHSRPFVAQLEHSKHAHIQGLISDPALRAKPLSSLFVLVPFHQLGELGLQLGAVVQPGTVVDRTPGCVDYLEVIEQLREIGWDHISSLALAVQGDTAGDRQGSILGVARMSDGHHAQTHVLPKVRLVAATLDHGQCTSTTVLSNRPLVVRHRGFGSTGRRATGGSNHKIVKRSELCLVVWALQPDELWLVLFDGEEQAEAVVFARTGLDVGVGAAEYLVLVSAHC